MNCLKLAWPALWCLHTGNAHWMSFLWYSSTFFTDKLHWTIINFLQTSIFYGSMATQNIPKTFCCKSAVRQYFCKTWIVKEQQYSSFWKFPFCQHKTWKETVGALLCDRYKQRVARSWYIYRVAILCTALRPLVCVPPSENNALGSFSKQPANANANASIALSYVVSERNFHKSYAGSFHSSSQETEQNWKKFENTLHMCQF